MYRDFNEFVSSLSLEDFFDIPIEQALNSSKIDMLKNMNISSDMLYSVTLTLHLLREYHAWLHQVPDDDSE